MQEIREDLAAQRPFELVDCTNRDQLQAAVVRHRIDTIYHLAALLSAAGWANANPIALTSAANSTSPERACARRGVGEGVGPFISTPRR